MKHELVVVMPVYNEEACICQVVDSWSEALKSLGIDYFMLVINDGSSDATAERLSIYRENKNIKVISKTNSGHGPTVLNGYQQAVHLAEWVFQTDSDDEMSPIHFKRLWNERIKYSAVFGYRSGRQQGTGRKLISLVSRLAVRLLFGSGITDVNTPYRLIRSDVLMRAIRNIPDDTFAPNILVSGSLITSGEPILNMPVPHEGRKSGVASIVRWRLWQAAIRSMLQTIKYKYMSTKFAC